MGGEEDVQESGHTRDVLQSGRTGPPSRRVGMLVAGGLVAAGVLALTQHGHDPSPPAQQATPAATSPPAGWGGPRSPVAPGVTKLGGPVLGVTSGWELLARGEGEVVRIQLARGRLTSTTVPPLQSSGPVSFVVGPHRAVVRPLDFVPGYAVPDGHGFRRLPARLGHGPVFPGPRPGTVWVQSGNGNDARAVLVGLDGRRTGETVTIPPGAGRVTADGRGYLLVADAGGVYDARPGGLHRVTAGEVVAAGPTGWLAAECDARHRCRHVLVDGDDGDRHELPGPAADITAPLGVISPDASRAAVFHATPDGELSLGLLDLATGTWRRTPVRVDREADEGGHVAWSPDSRMVFVVTSVHRLRVVDAATRRLRVLRVPLPEVSQVAVRGERPAKSGGGVTASP